MSELQMKNTVRIGAREIGIPGDWDTVELRGLIEISGSGEWGKETKTDTNSKRALVLRSGDITLDGGLSTEEIAIRFLSERDYERYAINPLDIVIVSSSGSEKHIGKKWLAPVTLAENKYHFTNFLYRIRLDDSLCSPRFVYYFLCSDFERTFLESITPTSTGLHNLDTDSYEDLTIPFPSLPEQRRIADIISTVEEQIQQTDRIIENTEELKEGLMQDLFTEGLNDNKSVKERLGAKIRKIPQHWDVVRLDEISDIKRGASPRPIGDDKYFGGDVGWIRISDITQTESKYVTEPSDYLSELGVSESVLIEPETLVLSISATIGKPAILQTEGCIHDGIVALRNLRENVDIEYLYYALQDLQPRIQAQNQRAAGHQTNVNSKVVRQSEVPLPPLKEQRKIAEVLGAADMKLEKEKDQSDKLKSLKRGLIQDLLTGKVRTPNDILD